ncbi:thymidine kinase [Actinoplanes sp. LDG1-06]|uniref:Thymidine kinase n=1 Tax=Paractinoplanes ovalisporus TaxID=2810368 RepID=A0ABS2A5T3_9ACTN|nr:thymidine kinase [Actinoplanes ovalisporus]MBM2615205.1 thymidine kinase [Actinoplanes ovalisporus]
MGQLHFRYAAMNSGKSTMVLQYRHTYAACGRNGLLMTRLDRAGEGIVSSRIGISADAIEFGATTDLAQIALTHPGTPVDHLIVDEAQFLSAAQVDQLAGLADDHDIDVFTFGLLSDFRGEQFPGSSRLVVLADVVEALQVYPMCWCGQQARMNARVSGGVMVRDGDTVLVGNTDSDAATRYVVLCRRHHRAGLPYAPAPEITLAA